jgi:class 3 adenylate cyclase
VEIPETRYLRTRDGIYLAYQVFGAAPTDILFLPGTIAHIEIHWEDPGFAAFLQGLASFARVIHVDRRGVGLSDRLSPNEVPPPEVLVDDVGDLLDEIGSGSTVLVGQDEGAQIGVLFAAAHPERLRSLVIYGSSPTNVWREHAPWSDDQQILDRWLGWMMQHYGSREAAIRDFQDTWPGHAFDEAELRFVSRLYRYGVSPSAFETLFRLGYQLDVTDVLPSVGMPTLVVHRRDDEVASVEAGRHIAATIPGAQLVELEGSGHFPNQGDVGELVEVIRKFVGGPQRPVDTSRRLATVLFTDIVGSTERAAELGDAAWKELLGQHHQLVRSELARFGGHEVDTAGDGFLATFDGPARAVRCAQAIGEAVRTLGLEIRAGVHTGEVEVEGGDVRGIAVHTGARVAALSGAGEVLVSSTVTDLVAGSGLMFEDRGMHELKGIPGEWHLFAVQPD